MKKSLRMLAGVATILAFTACMTGCLSSNTKKDVPAAKKTETKVNADARVIKIACRRKTPRNGDALWWPCQCGP